MQCISSKRICSFVYISSLFFSAYTRLCCYRCICAWYSDCITEFSGECSIVMWKDVHIARTHNGPVFSLRLTPNSSFIEEMFIACHALSNNNNHNSNHNNKSSRTSFGAPFALHLKCLQCDYATFLLHTLFLFSFRYNFSNCICGIAMRWHVIWI